MLFEIVTGEPSESMPPPKAALLTRRIEDSTVREAPEAPWLT